MDTKDFDIGDQSAFKKSVQSFKAVNVQLKKEGLGSVNHKALISRGDIKRLYQGDHPAFNVQTPCGLQNLVWFNIMLFFIRRGRENLRDMTKLTFSVKKDGDGLDYVSQDIDELDKNHRGDNTDISHGRMYAIPGKYP